MGEIAYIIDYKSDKTKVKIGMLATKGNVYYTDEEAIKYGLATKEEIEASKKSGTPMEFVKEYKIEKVANNTKDLAYQFFKSEDAFVQYVTQNNIDIKNAAVVDGKIKTSVKAADGRVIKYASLKRFDQDGYKGLYPLVVVSEVYNVFGVHLGYRIITSRTGKVILVTKEKLIEYSEKQIIKALLVEKNRELKEIKDLFKPIQNAKMILSRQSLYKVLLQATNGDTHTYEEVKSIIDKHLTAANDIESSYIACYSVLNPFPREYIPVKDNKYTVDTMKKIDKRIKATPNFLKSYSINEGDVGNAFVSSTEFTEHIKDTIRIAIKKRKFDEAKTCDKIPEPTTDDIRKFLLSEVYGIKDNVIRLKVERVRQAELDSDMSSEEIRDSVRTLIKARKLYGAKTNDGIPEPTMDDIREVLLSEVYGSKEDKAKEAKLDKVISVEQSNWKDKYYGNLVREHAILKDTLVREMFIYRYKIKGLRAEKELLRTRFPAVMSKAQKEILNDAKDSGLPAYFLGLLNNPRLSEYRMRVLVDLKKDGKQVDYLTDPDWTLEQFNYLYVTLLSGVPMKPFINFNYSPYVMSLIREAITLGINPSDFANPDYTTSQISAIYSSEKEKLWCSDLEIIEGTKFVRK